MIDSINKEAIPSTTANSKHPIPMPRGSAFSTNGGCVQDWKNGFVHFLIPLRGLRRSRDDDEPDDAGKSVPVRTLDNGASG
ncbi:hypothetical protein CFIMG_005898RA [Ceratocystis fimbriata CBS 114723]|uniref:Uncharacterized protein n=1 Tax=Ceratocystis fimbriata CBS 114723 TaxID=1035309 RepID=A0A2C5WLJ6_9PEZI|nr:hypothetical protein CFIMG_005898RA [Ceratocystis fimbriata CBS 114723]